jgi:hypothetical protein
VPRVRLGVGEREDPVVLEVEDRFGLLADVLRELLGRVVVAGDGGPLGLEPLRQLDPLRVELLAATSPRSTRSPQKTVNAAGDAFTSATASAMRFT